MIRMISTIAAMFAFALQFSTAAESAAPAGGEATKAAAAETEKPQAVQTMCPVMGGAVEDRSVFAIWKGDKTHGPKKVYFCCPGCIEEFNANPARYIKKLEKMEQPIEDVVLKQESKQLPGDDDAN